MKNKIFDISFVHDGRTYKGWVNPSDKLDALGKPASFHVVLDDESFGHLSFNNCTWSVSEERPGALVKLIGKQIEKRYQL